MKRQLHSAGVEPGSQWRFFSGKPLTDKMNSEELKVPKACVVQVIMSQALQSPTAAENWTGPVDCPQVPPAPFIVVIIS